MDKLIKRPDTKILGNSFELLPNALIIHGKPTEKSYEEAFRRLSLIETAQSWWWGDLANAREKHYGSLKELAEKYEKNYGSVRECQRVSKAYELSMRIDTLSFNHHQIAAAEDDRLEWLAKAEKGNWSCSELAKQIRLSKILPPPHEKYTPIITKADYIDWLPKQEQCDLLLTDPPYSTEISDIEIFASNWLPMALNKIKPTGRAYIFIGAYPKEIEAYLKIKTPKIVLSNILVWAYQNVIGPSSEFDYNLNWQAILYYRGLEVSKLECPILIEQFAVQNINAPDGRTGIRYSPWQKPAELAERFIRHSTRPGDLILDPFAGTGTFLLAATKFKRKAKGCDNSEDMVKIAIQRGCRASIRERRHED
jgi:DNA modification methylase